MTRVDFYLLADAAGPGMDLAVCRLAHKAFLRGHRIYILTAHEEQARRLDQLMWTFSASSFIPHALGSDSAEEDYPVLIGSGAPPASHEDVLIQLAPAVPEYFSRFQRVAEIVDGSEDGKARARERFRFYRDRGYALQTHYLTLDARGDGP
jgi:DNA polymerase-3 subunit chi